MGGGPRRLGPQDSTIAQAPLPRASLWLPADAPPCPASLKGFPRLLSPDTSMCRQDPISSLLPSSPWQHWCSAGQWPSPSPWAPGVDLISVACPLPPTVISPRVISTPAEVRQPQLGPSTARLSDGLASHSRLAQHNHCGQGHGDLHAAQSSGHSSALRPATTRTQWTPTTLGSSHPLTRASAGPLSPWGPVWPQHVPPASEVPL